MIAIDLNLVYQSSWHEMVTWKVVVDDVLGRRELRDKDVVLVMPCTLPAGLPFREPMEALGVELLQLLPKNHSRRFVYIGRRLVDNGQYCLVMPVDFNRELMVYPDNLNSNLVWLLGLPHQQPAPVPAGQT